MLSYFRFSLDPSDRQCNHGRSQPADQLLHSESTSLRFFLTSTLQAGSGEVGNAILCSLFLFHLPRGKVCACHKSPKAPSPSSPLSDRRFARPCLLRRIPSDTALAKQQTCQCPAKGQAARRFRFPWLSAHSSPVRRY